MRYSCCSHCEGGVFCPGRIFGHERPCTRWGCGRGPQVDVPPPVKCGHCGFPNVGRRTPCRECPAMVCPSCVEWRHHPDPVVLVRELP